MATKIFETITLLELDAKGGVPGAPKRPMETVWHPWVPYGILGYHKGTSFQILHLKDKLCPYHPISLHPSHLASPFLLVVVRHDGEGYVNYYSSRGFIAGEAQYG